MSTQNKTLLQPGRFVILLNGRHAGKKAIVLQAYPEPTEARKYPHAVVIGIQKSPKKLTKDMPQKTLVKRTQVKVFVKTVNFNHLLLTRHMMKDEDFWNKVKPDQVIKSMEDTEQKKAELQAISKVLRQKYLNGKMSWLFKPLKF
ncbi:ribosomal protein L27e [Histomonas meleagridis]|uniref:ribosomal protein L27e n=1 Tax=Histomonas meleagridis TaxID=135588 RepID=UPI00355AB78A|nr:ribosomal protein L27e [Histomonas meleagridis]KAH0804280.1 ribosomal protein L27e [Histomonas meleagridis]